jgi:hypothetical protein
MVMPVMMMMTMMVAMVLYFHHHLRLRDNRRRTAEEDESKQKSFHGLLDEWNRSLSRPLSREIILRSCKIVRTGNKQAIRRRREGV